jgi:hypothetical protein
MNHGSTLHCILAAAVIVAYFVVWHKCFWAWPVQWSLVEAQVFRLFQFFTIILSGPFLTTTENKEFFIFILSDFAKIYGPPQILQKYTSVAVAHDVRDLTS